MTITDLDAIRARLGVPDLTSEDLMTDRQAFWDRAEREAVLLTDGLLRADNSELWLDYDVTEDDVDWEVRFSGPDGGGYVLGFRPDQDMSRVQAAVDAGVGPLDGATVWPDLHLLTYGVAEEGDPVWASDPDLVDLVPDPAESTYLRQGCIPFAEALGTDATFEDQDAVLAEARRGRPGRPARRRDLVRRRRGHRVAGARSRRPVRPGRPGGRLADHRTDRVRRRLLR